MTKLSSLPQLSDMDYRIIRTLGNGAGSTILLISDRARGGQRFALKVVKRQDADDDVYIAQARHEADVAQRLNHPVILKIFDCRTKRAWFRVTGVELLMEYVEGHTLDEIEGPEMGQLLLIFIQIASALIHMHRRGIYHGDLKPSNIMLSRTGQVKLIDFGTAWIRGQEKNRIQGTPQYMAPEQATEKTVDDRTDIYNFGATMYRMFTGRYANVSTIGKANGSGSKAIAPIHISPRIPGTLNETIMACLEPLPEHRPAGMFEIKHQLVAVARYLGLKEKDLRGAEGPEE